MSWHEAIHLITIGSLVGCILFLTRLLDRAHHSRRKLHDRYMVALQQLTQSSKERFELMGEVATLMQRLQQREDEQAQNGSH